MMDCETAELYLEALLDNELPTKDSLEIINHIEKCSYCKDVWELNRETKNKLKHYVESINIPVNLTENAKIRLYDRKKVAYFFRPALIAASIPFLLSTMLIVNFYLSEFSMPAQIEKIHDSSTSIASKDINQLSKRLGVNLKENHFSAFNKALFEIDSVTQIPAKNIKLITLKNDKGHKVSLCFLPKSFQIINHSTNNINGTNYHCGKHKNSNFTYWVQNEKTIALVSDSLDYDEILNLALPFMDEDV